MTTRANAVPVGPPMEFQRAERVPIVIPLLTAGGEPFEEVNELYFRVFPRGGGAALYQVALAHTDEGRWTCTAEPDIAAGSYEYSVYDVDADRTYVRGPCTVVAAGTGPA